MPEAGRKKVVRKKAGVARRRKTGESSAGKGPAERTKTGISTRGKTNSGTRSKTHSGTSSSSGTISETSVVTRGGGKSSQKRAKISLALKFTLPVALMMIMVIALLAFYLSKMTTKSITNEILKSGVSQVAMMATSAKQMILKSGELYDLTRREFLEVVEPESVGKKTKDSGGKKKGSGDSAGSVNSDSPPWPVDLELVDADTFNKLARSWNLAGKKGKLDQFTDMRYVAARKTLYAALKSGLLGSYIRQENSEGKQISTQAVAAYVVCSWPQAVQLYTDDGNSEKQTASSILLARSDIPDGRIDELTIVNDEWIPKYVDITQYTLDEKPEAFTNIRESNPNNPCTVQPGLVNLEGKTYKILNFRMPIYNKGTRIGEVHLGLRAEDILTEVSRINNLMIITGLIGVGLAVITCVAIGFLVTRPVKTLITDMDIVASGNLEHKTRAHSGDEIGLLAVEFNEMTRRLLVASKKEKEAARLENELEMACEIQMKLLPPRLPRIKGFDIHAVYHPAKEVGGDYFDLFPIDKRHVGVIVADVSGKGIPGSMVMATTRTILRFTAGGNLSSADTLAKTNAMVAADIKRGMFVTAFYLVLDVLEKSILCSSAGHNPMVIHHASGEIELVNPNGIALGFDKGRIFSRTIKEQKISLSSGDRVVLYTDGVVESMNESNDEYTDERFYEFVKAHDKHSSEDFVNALLADLNRHKGRAEQHDDITVVTFRVL